MYCMDDIILYSENHVQLSHEFLERTGPRIRHQWILYYTCNGTKISAIETVSYRHILFSK